MPQLLQATFSPKPYQIPIMNLAVRKCGLRPVDFALQLIGVMWPPSNRKTSLHQPSYRAEMKPADQTQLNGSAQALARAASRTANEWPNPPFVTFSYLRHASGSMNLGA